MSREGDSRQTIEALLSKAASGDEHAWRGLVEAYSGRVFGLIRAQCGDADLAEEITQSTFCTIAAKIGSYTEVGRFEPWIFRIAMNRLRDEMRRRKRQARPVGDEALVGLAGTAEEPAAGEAADAERLRALKWAMGRLSDADQRIIHLRHHAGLSFRQIAEVLDQPLGTVLARQHRALKKLKELMGTQIDEDEPK
ncbi:MAG: RNA polymerase sigma factor [Phycisphaerales bacterium]|nr:MAG: RNA polymerase sigma factor [Phycisphaerales bacterium]